MNRLSTTFSVANFTTLRWCVVMGITWLITVQASATELDQLIKDALPAIPGVASARYTIQSASLNMAIAQQLSIGSAELTIEGNQKNASNFSSSIGLSLTQSIFPILWENPELSRSSIEVQTAEAQYQLTLAAIWREFGNAYIDVWNNREIIGIAQTIEDRRQKNVELLTARFNSGREHLGAWTWAGAQWDQAKIDTQIARRNKNLAEQKLRIMTGNPGISITTLNVNQFLTLPTAPDFDKIVANLPSVISKQLTILSLICSKRGVENTLGPTAKVAVMGTATQGSSASLSSGITGFVTVPLGLNGSTETKIKQADIAIAQATADYMAEIRNQKLQLIDAWNALKNAIDVLSVQTRLVAAAQKRSDIASAQYNSGLITYDNWDLIESQTISQMRQLQTAKVAVAKSNLDWQIQQHNLGGVR